MALVFRITLRRMAGLAVALAVLSGCGTPAERPSAAAPTHAPAPALAERLFIHNAGKGADERLTIVDSASGVVERQLPPGVVSPDWSTLYLAEAVGGSTRLSAIDIASGAFRFTAAIQGDYQLPMIMTDSALGGLSPDGKWLVLAATAPPAAGQSRFALIDTAFQRPPRTITLDGQFQFDGLSNNGLSLYLTESLTRAEHGEYQVRRYDVQLGALDPNVVVAKGEDEPMNGTRQTALTSRDGAWLYSLYLNPDHGPFIHALNMDSPVAACLDLPKIDGANPASQARWSLALAPDNQRLYAVNGALGQLVEVDLSEFPQIARASALFEPDAQREPAASAVPGGSITALAPDNRTLYTLGGAGLLVIDAKAHTLRGRYLADWSLGGLALAPDGERLYAASATRAKIVQLNTQTGAITAEVPVAASPGGIVRVETSRKNANP